MVRMTGHDWTASIHRLHGISFVFFCAYFNCNGDDPVGTNNKKIYQILECLRGLGIPGIPAADFNQTQQELDDLGWPALFRGHTIAPNVEFTCNSSGTKRVIDYLLVSNELMGMVHCTAVQGVPWGPHCGLKISIDRKPINNSAQQIHSPKSLPNLKDLRKDKDFNEVAVTWQKSLEMGKMRTKPRWGKNWKVGLGKPRKTC